MVDTAYDTRNLIESVVLFGRRLRDGGFNITQAHLENTMRGMEVIDIGVKAQFRALLRATLVSNESELNRFESFFKEFWDGSVSETDLHEDSTGSRGAGEYECEDGTGTEKNAGMQDGADWDVGGTAREEKIRLTAGLGTIDTQEDFSELSPEESDRIEALILRFAHRLGFRLSRRYRVFGRSGKIDFRNTLRRSLRHGGELLQFRYRRPKPIPSRIQLVLDISGSMDVYNRFFVVFMYGLQQALANTQSFIFSTHLTRVTPCLRSAQFHDAWNSIQSMPVNWSGGTDIGSSLMQFYSEYLASGSSRRAVVVIVSDGWDRGRPELLSEAMGLIHRHCRHLFWLNPLLSGRSYEPTCTGMRTALPYIDSFLPFDSLDSLVHLCQKIKSVW